jgi:hypothetical protein
MVRLIAAAAASPSLLTACAATPDTSATPAMPATSLGRASGRQPEGPAGTPTDPDLLHPVVPWPLTLDPSERRTLRALCDLILPAEGASPAAGAHGADAFIDEWVSAPYPDMQRDRAWIRTGLAWLEGESRRWYRVAFEALEPAQKRVLCDTICDLAVAPPELLAQALFFDRVRELACIACYTTAEGMAELGYVGNVALEAWHPPPAEVLRKAGLE